MNSHSISILGFIWKYNATIQVFVYTLHTCVCVCVSGSRIGSPVIWSDGVTVEVGAINVETCSLHHVLGYHAQTVQNVAQLTKRMRKENVILILYLLMFCVSVSQNDVQYFDFCGGVLKGLTTSMAGRVILTIEKIQCYWYPAF